MSTTVKDIIDATLSIVRTAPYARPSVPCSLDDFKRHVFEAVTGRPAVGNVATLMSSLDEGDIAYMVADRNKRVSFDCENVCSLEYDEENGHRFLVLEAGGDWEYPVTSYLYWTGTALAGFIPVDGNTYNKITNSAFGSEPNGIANLPEDEALSDLISKYESENNTDDDEGIYPVLGLIEYKKDDWRSLFSDLTEGYPSHSDLASISDSAIDIVKPDRFLMRRELLHATSIEK